MKIIIKVIFLMVLGLSVVSCGGGMNKLGEGINKLFNNTDNPKDQKVSEKKRDFCLSEICIGDNIFNINKTWKPIKDKKLKSFQRRGLFGSGFYKTSPHNLKKLSAYIRGEVFDSKALELLKNMKQTCERISLKGSFITKSGYETRIQIRSKSTNEGVEFVVGMIERVFWGVGSRDAKAKDIEKSLLDVFPNMNSDNNPKFRSNVELSTGIGALKLIILPERESYENLKGVDFQDIELCKPKSTSIE